MKSKRNFRKNTKKNKTRKKRGGGLNEDALFAAVKAENGERLNAILKLLGPDVNARNNYRKTPLFYACEKGNMNIAQALIDNGADIDVRDVDGKTPLEIAKETIDKEKLRNAAAEYKKKNNPNNANEELFAAVKKKETTAADINAILDKGANVNARNVLQSTPLHIACGNGHMELAMALVDRGADVDARDVAQRTPLHWACVDGHMEVAMALVDRGADVDANNK